MDFTKNYKLYKLYNGSYINNLQYVNANLDKIDELLAMAGGDSVISGTSVPSSDLGEDNTIYLQYEIDAGVTSIKAVYGKIDGEWLSLPDGGDVEDVRVNGTSVVSNKIAYITLPENGNISYGTTYPSGGEDADVYLRLGVLTDDILSEDAFHCYSSTYHPMTLSSFTRIARNQFSFSFQGNPDSSGNGETAWFDLAGLVPGKTYTLEFDHQFGSGTTFPWQSYHDRLIISGTTVYLEPSDTALHHYTTTFTYTEGATAWFNYPRVDDNRNYTSSFTNFTITGSFANNIEDIYGKCEGMWERYLGGLKYFVETPDSLYGTTALSSPRWSCLDGYYFDYPVEDHVGINDPSEHTPVIKANDVPAIICGVITNSTGHIGNYYVGGIVFISKSPEGTNYTMERGGVTYSGGYSVGDTRLDGNTANMVETYEYDGETWYVAVMGSLGLSGGGYPQDGNILHPSGIGGDSKNIHTVVGEIFNLVDPYEIDKCYSGLHQGDNLAFFAGGIDEDGTDAPIKIFTDGTTQGFPGGLVDDVEVDGSSVVVNKVANIDLATPLATKQNVLTAGANITIQNDVISATSAEYRDFQGATQLADGTNGLVPKPFKRQDNKFLQGNGGWGSVVLTGTSAPTSGQGFNDNIYVEYDGTSSSTSTQLYSQRAPGGKTTWSMELDTSSYDQVRVELVWGGVDTTISVADIYSTGVTVTLASGYAYLTFDHSTVTYSNDQYFNDWILHIYGINLIITPTSCEGMYTKINGTWLPLGLQNSIHDVQVDGTSVVTSGVAEIDLSNYATLSDIPEIEANPQDTPTDVLNSININGTAYEIQGGGGGSNLIIDAQIYSTEEKQVGVWTDGKPLYQKTYANVNLSNNQDVVIDTNVSTMQLKSYVIDFSGTTNTSTKQIGDTSDTLYIDSRGLVYWINRPSGWWSALNNANITVWYTKTTDSAGSGGYQAYGFSPIIYSTEEREVGVWTDNKPLYQKTWIETIPNASGFASFTNNPITNLDKVISTEYSVRYKGQQGETPWYTSASVYYDSMDTTGFSFYFNGTYLAGNYIVFTARYTKTTDTAGSGEYNTLGIPNVHYDGSEKVVGTWFGETLYEKTFTGLATNTNGDNWVNISGIDATTWEDAVNVEIYSNSSDVNNKLTRIALGEARVFNGNVQVTTSVSYNRQINVATIRYTKTT